MPRLTNKLALVTGAAQGVGRATAARFRAECAVVIVIVTDINDSVGVTVAAQFSERAEYHHLDVSQESDWQSVCSLSDRPLL
jgi:NAD(P)-dependent dehydrogenase (short-subunit alcohol dehydrogenase family)